MVPFEDIWSFNSIEVVGFVVDFVRSSDSDSELAGDALVVPVPDTTHWTPGRCIVFLNSFNIICQIYFLLVV